MTIHESRKTINGQRQFIEGYREEERLTGQSRKAEIVACECEITRLGRELERLIKEVGR